MVDLGDHQLKAIRQLKSGRILKGGVGTGKSRTALVYFYTHVCGGKLPVNGVGSWEPMENPKDLYIITTARKRDSMDWQGEAVKYSISTKPELNYRQNKFVVDSWNNIEKYLEVENAFFIFDEQRLVGSGAWVKAFLKLAKRNNWIMLSATPGDNWMDYVPVIVANGYYKNRAEFLREHVVWSPHATFPKVDRYVGTDRLEQLREALIVDMPYARHTTRHVVQRIVPYDQEQYRRAAVDRWHVFEDRPIRDAAELVNVLRRIVNGDPSRMGEVLKLLETHPRLVVFYNFDYELAALRTLADVIHFPVAEWNGHKHEEVPEDNGWLYLVQYTAGAEAWECTETDAEVFFSLNYSYKVWEQAMGRIDRMNTGYKDLYYYILRSGSSIDTSIMKSIALKKKFNEKKFIAKENLYIEPHVY